MTDGLVKCCQVETRRCRAAVAKGSPVDFWRRRLKGLLDKLDSARRIVQSCVDELPGGEGSHILERRAVVRMSADQPAATMGYELVPLAEAERRLDEQLTRLSAAGGTPEGK